MGQEGLLAFTLIWFICFTILCQWAKSIVKVINLLNQYQGAKQIISNGK